MECVAGGEEAAVFDRQPALPEQNVRCQVGLDVRIGELLERSRAQHDHDCEDEKGLIKPGETVEEEAHEIEAGLRAPVPMAVAQRDDVAAQREEDRHADAGGCAAPL